MLFNAPQTLAAEQAAPQMTSVKGKVLETMTSGGYTYLQVQAQNGPVWVAMPKTTVKKGEQVTCKPGMAMSNFPSKSLKRTFDTIIFSSGLANGATGTSPHNKIAVAPATAAGGDTSFAAALQKEKSSGMGAGMGAGMGMAGARMAGAGGSTENIVPSKEVSVEKATGSNAYTVGECFKEGKKLNDKPVQIRGKVVKVSKMIMGKNWIHIQDGTGNPMNNTHDLVVTTMDAPAMDSVVLVTGTLHADKDFGAGYKYNVIIEDAKVK